MTEAPYPLLPRPLDEPELPAGFVATVPTTRDLGALQDLVLAARRAVRPAARIDRDLLAARVTGTGSWTRTQVIVRAVSPALRSAFDGADPGTGPVLAWASIHDRAAGRSDIELEVDPGADHARPLGPALLRWARGVASRMARGRGLPATQLSVDLDEADARLIGWLAAGGYQHARTWLEMTRPAQPEDRLLPGPRVGVRVRRVASHADGAPVAQDVQTVHRMLEESFEDHFNSYHESFPEFAERLRESPGHRWDHWWIAEVQDGGAENAARPDGIWRPGGSLVSSVLPAGPGGTAGSYIDYIGVHLTARRRGVAKALLHAVLRDAAARGRSRVNLDVDADSPSGADGLYRALGWVLDHRVESWHAQQEAAPRPA